MQLETTGFSPAPDAICQDPDLGPIAAVVFGKMWRYCQMSDGVCKASMERIATECGISRNTALSHARKLCEKGWLTDTTPDANDKPHVYAEMGRFRMRLSFEGTPPLQILNTPPPKTGGKEDDRGEDDEEEKTLTVPQKAERMCKVLETNLRIQALPVIRESILRLANTLSIAFFRECVDAAAKNNAYSWAYVEAIIANGGPRANEKRPKPSARPNPYMSPRVAANGGQQLPQNFTDY